MEYPLFINGREQGKLRVEREGLYTVYEAELPEMKDGLYRLWLHGGEDCVYLGMMQPWSGGMYLRKKLSRREQESFPTQIDFASNEENKSLHKNNTKENTAENKAETNGIDLHNAKETEPEVCPWPAPIDLDGDELQWFRRPDGSLVSFDGISSLVALPAKLRKTAPGAVLKTIDGGEYMIFRY